MVVLFSVLSCVCFLKKKTTTEEFQQLSEKQPDSKALEEGVRITLASRLRQVTFST